MSLGDRIRALRQEAGLTLARVAENSGLSVSFLSDIEHDRRLPRLDALVRIAAVFEIDAITLLRGVAPFDRSTSQGRATM